MSSRPDGQDQRDGADHWPALRARLELPSGPLELSVRPRGARPVGPATVAALAGTDGGTGHRIVVSGRSVAGLTPARRVRAGLVVVRARAPVAPRVSVRDHLAAVAGTRTAGRLVAAAPLLDGRGHQPAGTLSGGERRVLAWLRAEALEPHVLVADAAGTGLDDHTLGWIGGRVDRLRHRGTAVLVRAGRPREAAWLGTSAVTGTDRAR